MSCRNTASWHSGMPQLSSEASITISDGQSEYKARMTSACRGLVPTRPQVGPKAAASEFATSGEVVVNVCQSMVRDGWSAVDGRALSPVVDCRRNM
jgi:hypothetical protein